MKLNFAYNPTSWANGPILGGMADCLIRPILPHLHHDYTLTNCPTSGRVNVWLTFPITYGLGGVPADSVNVFVSHGIADKSWRNAGKVQQFDHVFVSGPWWRRKMLDGGLPPERVHEVGYCKLDPIFQGRVESPWGERDGRVRVLYAPTHGGGGEKYRFATRAPNSSGARRSSYWQRDAILSHLPSDRFDVKVALHPRHRPDGRSTLAEYVGADVVIADGGSTIYEAWALDLPVVFPSWLTARANKNRATLEADIYQRRIGSHVTTPAALDAAVCQAAEHGITRPEQRFVADILPVEYRGTSGQAHAEALDRIVEDSWHASTSTPTSTRS